MSTNEKTIRAAMEKLAGAADHDDDKAMKAAGLALLAIFLLTLDRIADGLAAKSPESKQ